MEVAERACEKRGEEKKVGEKRERFVVGRPRSSMHAAGSGSLEKKRNADG